MSDFSEFNNNNYMPGFYGDMNSIARHNLAAALNMRGNVVTQSFTFTSPSHGSAMSTPRMINTHVGYLGAPGMGTTWQHSVPTTMTFSSMTPTMTQQGVLSFMDHGGKPPFSGFSATMEPQPSCSSPMKRPKRKAIEYVEDAPMSKVYRCADQFANLRISPDISRKSDAQDRAGWERFREIENSINGDCEDEFMGKVEKLAANKRKGILIMDDNVQNALSSTSPILPKSVLTDITKPSLQVVLWKCPGEILRDVVKEDSSTSLLISPSSTSSASSSPSSLGANSLSSPSPGSLPQRLASTLTPHNIRDSAMEDILLPPSPSCDPVGGPRSSLSSLSSSSASSSSTHFPANPSCLLSPSSPSPLLKWLHPSSSSQNQLHLPSSGPMAYGPFGKLDSMTAPCGTSDLLDDDMQL